MTTTDDALPRTRERLGRLRTAVGDATAPLVGELRDSWALLYVRHGFWGAMLIALGAFTPAFLPPDALDGVGLEWLADGASRVLATGLILGGAAILLHAWLRLRPAPHAGRGTAPAATVLIWSLPFLLAPPLFSRDAYSYAAQGLIVGRGMDPYTTAPVSVPGAFADNVDAVWLFTPAPYGPLALEVQRLVVDLTFGNAYVAAVAMRIPALLSVCVLAYALPRLAERLGVRRDGAVWLGVLNPLVVMHLVGGAHNDAMMIALVVVALLFATDAALVPAAIAIAAAAGFKQTAVLALVGVAGLAARRLAGGRRPDLRTYLWTCLRAGLAALVAFAALTFATGLGWGWIANLSVPMQMRSYLAPTTLLGSIVQLVMSTTGASAAWSAMPVPAFQALGAVVALASLAWLTWSVAPRHPVGAACAAFAVVVACGPVVQPWYVLPPLVLLGVVHAGRRAAQAAVWATIFLVGYSGFDVGMGNGVWVVGLVIIVWAVWRLGRSRTDVVDGPLCAPLGDGAGEHSSTSASPAPVARS